jgi:(1->4)-alpha-D-glucan 1-alpha-D-glucosylmutase
MSQRFYRIINSGAYVTEEKNLVPRIPVSTYRLQFNDDFTFSDAAKVIPYLSKLGITDIYSSPYFKAAKGSLHGYDIVAPDTLNPDIGTEEEYDFMIGELHAREMGQILDFVPNHMCITSRENIWWMDVLENGPSSVYNDFFDIDWNPVKKELKNKVLLPVLGDQYGKVLDKGELRLTFEEGSFFLYYYEHKFPIIPKTYNHILKHRIDKLSRTFHPEDPFYAELLSIITALNNLPSYTEKNSEKIVERHREKEIIKKRLSRLYYESAMIRTFLDDNIRIFNGISGDQRSFDHLDQLLSMQVYRLSHWRVATEEINYRRFFDINSLGAIRMENENVFNATHALVMKFIREGKVTGLRLDHPDGLYDPSEYFKRLQKSCFLQLRLAYAEKLNAEIPLSGELSDFMAKSLKMYDEIIASGKQDKFFYIIGEKILTKGERMPEEWPIFSTTGYVFLNSLNGIFVETRNAKAFEDIYNKFIKEKVNFHEIVYRKKKLIMKVSMSSEINTLGHYLNVLSEKDRHTRDFTLNSLTAAIVEIIAYFPVYRTYINSFEVNDRDRQYVEFVIQKAKKKNPALSSSIFEFLKDVLLLQFPDNFGAGEKREWLDFVMRFQQLTGPVMAKGLEDTAFYIYNRLVSLNEVGGMPDRFGTPLETFHGQNIERNKYWPHALITTSTHDTKRGEDVRVRIDVLSEMPGEWGKKLIFWRRINKKKRLLVDGQFVPDLNEEYFLYQTLVGVWPVGGTDEDGYEVFKNRIKDYMIKAIREAKLNTSWINVNSTYEEALMIYIDSLLDSAPNNQFLRDFQAFQRSIAHQGFFNSLSQAVLKITSPGIPDFYQGTELWEFSLVDPDNRRPVDYAMRMEMLDELIRKENGSGPLNLLQSLVAEKENGMIKLYVIYKALVFRRENKDLFSNGEYVPLECHDARCDTICAFLRRHGHRNVITVVPRLLRKVLAGGEELPLGRNVWDDSTIIVPSSDIGVKYRNIFTGETVAVAKSEEANSLRLADIFANSPVAILEML